MGRSPGFFDHSLLSGIYGIDGPFSDACGRLALPDWRGIVSGWKIWFAAWPPAWRHPHRGPEWRVLLSAGDFDFDFDCADGTVKSHWAVLE